MTEGRVDRQGAARAGAVRLMILGTVVAVLAPLGGFLGGSMVGPAQRFGELDAMYFWMFAGLVVGGLGAILVLLGMVRWVRLNRPAEPLA